VKDCVEAFWTQVHCVTMSASRSPVPDVLRLQSKLGSAGASSEQPVIATKAIATAHEIRHRIR
jgi:hypothetical protein